MKPMEPYRQIDMFPQQFLQADNSENIEAPINWPFVGGNHPVDAGLTKGQ